MSKKAHEHNEGNTTEAKPSQAKPADEKHQDKKHQAKHQAKNQDKKHPEKNEHREPKLTTPGAVIETLHIQSVAKKTHDIRSPQLTTNNFAVATMCVKAGDRVEERSLSTEKIYLVARGEGMMTVGTTTTSLDKGEMIVVPAGQPHSLKADDDDDFKLITIECVQADLHPVALTKPATAAKITASKSVVNPGAGGATNVKKA